MMTSQLLVDKYHPPTLSIRAAQEICAIADNVRPNLVEGNEGFRMYAYDI